MNFHEIICKGSLVIQNLTTAIRNSINPPDAGRLAYDSDEQSLYFSNGLKWKDIGRSETGNIDVVNNTGSTLQKASVMTVDISNTTDLSISVLRATYPLDFTNSVIGLLDRQVLDGGVGKLVYSGILRTDTTSWVSGSMLYLDLNNAGELTTTRPAPIMGTKPYPILCVGKVLYSNINGYILVNPYVEPFEIDDIIPGNWTGYDRKLWSSKFVADQIDSLTPYLTVTGGIIPFAGSVAPESWLLCDGDAVSRTTYSDLFALIGETYGAGDGVTTFNVPNLVGRTVLGASVDHLLAEFGGSEIIEESNLPSHTHPTVSTTKTVVNGVGGASFVTTTSVASNDFTGASGSTGDGQSYLPPYLTLNYIIKI